MVKQYKHVCITLYFSDIERLDGLVADAKSKGYTRMNKSAIIRAALQQFDVGRLDAEAYAVSMGHDAAKKEGEQ